MTLIEHINRNADLHPGKPAVICGDRRITWQQFQERSNRVANRLTRLRVARGERVAIVAGNCLEYPEILFGALKAGTVTVPVPIDTTPEGVAKELLKADAKAVFVAHPALPLAAGFRKLCTRVVFEGREEGWLSYEGFLLAGSDSTPTQVPSPEDLFSPGTTHGERLRFAEACRREWQIEENSVSLIGTPLYAEATQRLSLPTILAGGTLVLMRSFDPVDFVELVRRESCTHAILFPEQKDTNSDNFAKNEITYVEFV